MIMERVLLKISYLGSAYHGWQVQPNGITVQEVLQSKIEQLYKAKISLTGCSRTDAGVHAKEFYCHFDAPFHINTDGIVKGLNSLLPRDISVYSAEYVAADFHSRYSSKGKNYIYLIENTAVRNPFNIGRAWHIERPLSVDIMNEFCQKLCGTHDFYGFSSSGRTVETTVRTVYNCSVSKDNELITLSVSGDGFLYNMVRIIVGTAVDVSDGKINISDIEEILLSKERSRAGITAPPDGLYLNKVFY